MTRRPADYGISIMVSLSPELATVDPGNQQNFFLVTQR